MPATHLILVESIASKQLQDNLVKGSSPEYTLCIYNPDSHSKCTVSILNFIGSRDLLGFQKFFFSSLPAVYLQTKLLDTPDVEIIRDIRPVKITRTLFSPGVGQVLISDILNVKIMCWHGSDHAQPSPLLASKLTTNHQIQNTRTSGPQNSTECYFLISSCIHPSTHWLFSMQQTSGSTLSSFWISYPLTLSVRMRLGHLWKETLGNLIRNIIFQLTMQSSWP